MSVAAGLILAGIFWLIFGVHTTALGALNRMDQRLAALPAVTSRSLAEEGIASRILAAPLFALTTGPGAVTEATIHLEGLVITPALKAVLVSIDGKTPDWLTLGASRDGVTLIDVQGSKATFDTATGFKDVGLGDAGPGSGPGVAAQASSNSPPGQGLQPPPPNAANAR